MIKSSIFICFTGIDGSGKSSQAQLLQKRLNAYGFNTSYTWSRWEPYLLKTFIKIFKRSHTQKKETLSYHDTIRSRKRRILSRPTVLWLWLNVSLFEYYWQVRRRVLRHMVGNNIVICDRYLFDFLVDQAVNMGKMTDGIEHILRLSLTRLFPLPDLLFILDVEAERGRTRKQDGTNIEYLIERRELYHYFYNMPNATIINANNPFDMVACQIIKETIKYLRGCGVIND